MLFSASQITRENQGVDVKGAFSWRVVDPLKAYQNLNMTRMSSSEVLELMGSRSSTGECGVDHGPLMRTTLLIRQLAESVTRNAIANMSLEGALRDRRAIVDTLTRQIDMVIGSWGVAITSIEIVDVYISSAEMFGNMQAEYREQMRRQARVAQIGSDEEIAQQELAAKTRLSAHEHEQQMNSLKLKASRGEREIAVNKAIEEQKQAAAVELAWQKTQAEARRQKAEAESAVEREQMHHVAAMVRRRELLELRRQRMEVLGTANEAYRSQQLLNALPALAQSMKADKTTVISNNGAGTLEGLMTTVAGLAHNLGAAWPAKP
jgi:hypothetical protein